MARADEVLSNSYDETDNAIRVLLEGGIYPGFEAFYKEDTGNQTYTTATVGWDNTYEAHFFDIYNSGSADLTIKINNGVIRTVKAGNSLGAIGVRDAITEVVILATDTFVLLIRE